MNTKILRQKILDLAIRGRLVPQDPNDEPAAVLLQCIHEEKQRLVKEKKLKKKDLETSPIAEEDIPFQLPQGWEWCRLGEVAFVTKLAGFEYTKYIADNLCGNEGIPLFKGKNVQDGKIIYEFESFIPESISNELLRSQIIRPCLLTPYVGTIGNIGLHNKIGKYHLGSNVGKIEILCPDEHLELVNIYLLNYLRSTIGLKQLSKHKKSTAQDSISIQAIRDVFLPLPPLSEQRRIVSAVEKWMSVIDALETSAADLQQFTEIAKKRILDLAIRGKLVEKEGEWEEKTLGEVAIYINGRAFKPTEWEDAGKPIIRIQNLNDPNAKYNYSSKEHESKYLIQKGDLLFAWAASLGTYIWDGQDAWLNQHIFKVIPHDFIEKRFLNLALDAMIASLYTRSHGSGMVHITKAEFIKTPIFVPPLSEQRRIVSKVEDLFAAIDTIAQAVV